MFSCSRNKQGFKQGKNSPEWIAWKKKSGSLYCFVWKPESSFSMEPKNGMGRGINTFSVGRGIVAYALSLLLSSCLVKFRNPSEKFISGLTRFFVTDGFKYWRVVSDQEK